MQTNIRDFLLEQAEQEDDLRVKPQPLDEDAFLAELHAFCPGFDLREADLFPVLYRGNDDQNVMAKWPTRPQRLARYGIGSKKLVNMIADEWAGWPKRSRSVFVANKHRNATYFGGEVHIVIPRLRTALAVCPSEDFVNTPPQVDDWLGKKVYTLNSLSRAMAFMIRKVAELKKIDVPGNKYGWQGPETLQGLRDGLAIVDKHRQALWAEAQSKDMAWDTDGNYALIKAILQTSEGRPLFDYLSDMLQPEPNGFLQLHYGGPGWSGLAPLPSGNELWFEGEYLAIELRACKALAKRDPRFTVPDR